MGAKSSKERAINEAYLHPHGVHVKPPPELDRKKLKRHILEGKIAPCYPPKTQETPQMEECPICFYMFPSLNRSTCCSSGICTECFLQCSKTKPASCPFCMQPGYCVKFSGALPARERERRFKEEQATNEAHRKACQAEEERRRQAAEGSSSTASVRVGKAVKPVLAGGLVPLPQIAAPSTFPTPASATEAETPQEFIPRSDGRAPQLLTSAQRHNIQQQLAAMGLDDSLDVLDFLPQTAGEHANLSDEINDMLLMQAMYASMMDNGPPDAGEASSDVDPADLVDVLPPASPLAPAAPHAANGAGPSHQPAAGTAPQVAPLEHSNGDVHFHVHQSNGDVNFHIHQQLHQAETATAVAVPAPALAAALPEGAIGSQAVNPGDAAAASGEAGNGGASAGLSDGMLDAAQLATMLASVLPPSQDLDAAPSVPAAGVQGGVETVAPAGGQAGIYPDAELEQALQASLAATGSTDGAASEDTVVAAGLPTSQPAAGSAESGVALSKTANGDSAAVLSGSSFEGTAAGLQPAQQLGVPAPAPGAAGKGVERLVQGRSSITITTRDPWHLDDNLQRRVMEEVPTGGHDTIVGMVLTHFMFDPSASAGPPASDTGAPPVPSALVEPESSPAAGESAGSTGDGGSIGLDLEGGAVLLQLPDGSTQYALLVNPDSQPTPQPPAAPTPKGTPEMETYVPLRDAHDLRILSAIEQDDAAIRRAYERPEGPSARSDQDPQPGLSAAAAAAQEGAPIQGEGNWLERMRAADEALRAVLDSRDADVARAAGRQG